MPDPKLLDTNDWNIIRDMIKEQVYSTLEDMSGDPQEYWYTQEQIRRTLRKLKFSDQEIFNMFRNYPLDIPMDSNMTPQERYNKLEQLIPSQNLFRNTDISNDHNYNELDDQDLQELKEGILYDLKQCDFETFEGIDNQQDKDKLIAEINKLFLL